MRRFLVDPVLADSGQARLTHSQAHHALRVLRLKPGDMVVLIDGRGHEWEARITAAARGLVELEIIEKRASIPEPLLDLTLGLAVLKASPMDLVVQKGTELGLKTLVPLYSSLSAVRLNKKQAAKRVTRWRKIALEALKQCERGWPVRIEPLTSLEDFLAAASQADLKLMLYAGKRNTSTASPKELFSQKGKLKSIRALVGPEGGFTPAEAAQAEEAGFEVIGLGPRVMRSETAALALVAILGFELGDLSIFD